MRTWCESKGRDEMRKFSSYLNSIKLHDRHLCEDEDFLIIKFISIFVHHKYDSLWWNKKMTIKMFFIILSIGTQY